MGLTVKRALSLLYHLEFAYLFIRLNLWKHWLKTVAKILTDGYNKDSGG